MRRLALAIVLTTASAISFAFAQQASPRPAREPDIKLHCSNERSSHSIAIWQRERVCGFIEAPWIVPCQVSEASFVFTPLTPCAFNIDRVDGNLRLACSDGSSARYACKPITPGTKKF